MLVLAPIALAARFIAWTGNCRPLVQNEAPRTARAARAAIDGPVPAFGTLLPAAFPLAALAFAVLARPLTRAAEALARAAGRLVKAVTRPAFNQGFAPPHLPRLSASSDTGARPGWS